MTFDRFMRRAVDLAQAHRTHPNPRVGALVLSSDGSVVGEGAHIAAGEPHAEVVALEAAGDAAAGGTLVVTLEPCSHHGRTPPCADAIIDSGLSRVVVAMRDPDERVSGSGLERLAAAGVEVVEGVLVDEAAAINEAYVHHRSTGMPRVTMKWAMTLDGAVAAADGTSRWISSEEARRDAHKLRAEVDAVVVGAGTLRADDPRLDVRIDGYDGPQPVPVIIVGRDPLPEESAIWQRSPIVVAPDDLDVPAGSVVVVDSSQGVPTPSGACKALGELGHLDILLEGGPTLAGAWWNAGVVNRGVVYLAAKVGGGAGLAPLGGVFGTIEGAEIVEITATRSLGPDQRIDFVRK